MRVEPLTVGPIVGETTSQSVRLWGRGEYASRNDRPMRCFGVCRLRPASESEWTQPRFFKMNPNFDMTGIAVFTGLPAGSYQYEIGWSFADLELEQAAQLPAEGLDWSRASGGRFTTASADPTEKRSVLFGSCRYLLSLFGGSLFDDRGDKTYRSMLEGHIDGNGDPADSLFLVGDQIYADDLNIADPDTRIDQYFRRYRAVFTQEHQRKVMSRLPVYMILDDHEIEDNWPEKASGRDWVTKYPAAMHAYLTYQASHSPLLPIAERHLTGVPEKLWYTFSDGCYDAFVMDTRTERFLEAEEREIVSKDQLSALKAWLGREEAADKVKLVVSAVPLFPDSRRLSEDKWSGFPTQRRHLLDHMRGEGIRKVVFLSGDIHVSLSAELRHDEDEEFQIISVVSSSLFWPYPHPRREGFHLSGELQTDKDSGYRVVECGRMWPVDNFTRLDISPDVLKIRHFGRKGDLLGEPRSHHFL